jgi:hypothetical protein
MRIKARYLALIVASAAVISIGWRPGALNSGESPAPQVAPVEVVETPDGLTQDEAARRLCPHHRCDFNRLFELHR